jgi:hypothetical protein
MNHIEFSVSRIQQLWNGNWDDPKFLAEIAYLYDQMVQTGTHEPVIEVGMKLMIPFMEVGEAVAYSMEKGYISAPKRGMFGGVITNKSRKVLGQPLVKPEPRKKAD